MVCTTLHIGADGPERDSLDSRMEEGCYFLLHDTRSAKGEREDIRRWLNSLMTPVNLLYHCEPLYQRHWWPAYGLLLRWHHSKLIPPCEKPADLTELTLTYYQDHHEYHAIGKLLQQLLAEQGVKLTINITDYDTGLTAIVTVISGWRPPTFISRWIFRFSPPCTSCRCCAVWAMTCVRR